MNQSRSFIIFRSLGVGMSIVLFFACQQNDSSVSPATTPGSTTAGTAVPEVYKKLYGATSIYVEGTNVVIKTTSRPDHKSPYYKGTQWESTQYEAYTGTNPKFAINPNRIAQVNLTFKLPLNPVVDASHSATPMGPIGISLNGVPFFNQYAAMSAPLTNEINGFDQYGGHPQQQGQYHYHVEPVYLTTAKGKDALMGFLLDGFPVYGPVENGKTVTNTDLDKYHGHTAATPDYPNGIYHYHITAEDPYIGGTGFYGKAGTLTQ